MTLDFWQIVFLLIASPALITIGIVLFVLCAMMMGYALGFIGIACELLMTSFRNWNKTKGGLIND